MKRKLLWTFVWVLMAFRSLASPSTTTGSIRVDQFGYLQNSRKVAVIINPQVGSNADQKFNASTGENQYQVRRWADDAVVFSGTIQSWKNGTVQASSGDQGWWFDFSVVNTPGSYYIFDVGNNVGSYRFEIGDHVYNEVLKAAVRTYFYQRINFEKKTPFTDAKWADAATHEGPGQDRQVTSRHDKGNMATVRDLHGGWMDAGDMNKYVTFAEEPVALLVESYRLNPSVFGDNFNIPESGNGIPDVLDEVKWELDFMKRMQDATGTGGLFLKVGVDNYNETNPPSADKRPRYYLPECTSSTLSGAAMFAVSGAVFRTIPALNTYAQDLIARAEQAFARAKVTTNYFTTFETNCDDGNIKSGDSDKPADIQKQSAVVAAIYLFEATGKAEYKVFVDQYYSQIQPIANEWWGPYLMHVHIALLRYASNPAATPSVATRIRSMKSVQNGVLSINDYNARTDLYRAHMADAQYHWGSNQVRGNAGIVNMDFVDFNINGSNKALYREVAEQYLHWFHGVNAQGKVMLSNMYAYGAENSQNEIYHTWFADGTEWDNALTSPRGPAPGYLTGGPNNMNQYDGTQGDIRNEPLQKRYKDWNTGFPENSWIFTEVAIYNQAPYISLLSRLMTPTSDPTDTEAPTAPNQLVASDLSPYSVKLTWNGSVDNRAVTAYEIYQNGTKVAETPQTYFNLTTLSPGTTYEFTIKAIDFSANRSNPSNAVTVNTPAPSPNDYIIYGDALKSTFTNWSWNSTQDFANTAPVKSGERSLKVTTTAAWGALSLRNSEILRTSNYPGGVQFWFYGTEKPVRVTVNQTETGESSSSYRISAEPNTWTLVRIPWSEWGDVPQIQRINFMDGSGELQSFIIDDVRLVAGQSTPDTQAPSTPSNLTATNVTGNSLRLTWTASTDNIGVKAYEVYRGTTLLDGNVTTNQLDVTGLSCTTNYNFTVKARDEAGNVSGSSNTIYVNTLYCSDSQAPKVPANLTASNLTGTGLTLTWEASTDNVRVTAYEVYRNGTLINGNVTGTSLPVTGLSCNTAYNFTILAKDAAGNKSAQSPALTITTPECGDSQAPGVPTSLSASNVTASGLTLTWTGAADNVGVVAYEVYQNGTLLNGNVTGTSLAVSNLACGTTYSYTVLAKDAAGNKSASSTALNATTLACPPAEPNGREVIYDEALHANWQEWGWGINPNYTNASPVKVGQKSLAINYTSGWGGWSIIRNSHFTTTAQTTIRFWIYATTNKTIGVCTFSENETGQSPYVSFQPTPNVWQEVVITMPQLANPARIKRMIIQAQASDPNLIYVDNIRLEPSINLTASQVTTTSLRLDWTAPTDITASAYEVYQDGTLLNGNVTGTSYEVAGLTCGTAYYFEVVAKEAASTTTVRSIPLNVKTVACPNTSTVEMVYDEALNGAWQEWSWGINRNYSSTSQVKAGEKALSITYNGGWGGWSIIRNAHFVPTPQSTLRFWIYATTNKKIGVYTNAENDGQQSQVAAFVPTPNAWQEVVIPMSQLGNPARIKRITVQSQASGDNLIYLDNVRLETPNSNQAARLAAPSAEAPAESRLLVSPNPTDGPVKVQVWTGEAQEATLTVLSATGQPVYFQPVQAQAGMNEYTPDLSQLTPGVYLVQWSTATRRLVQRLVLTK
ncbi:glycoside hydrolase family 9 protein [Telluribacter sp. SYSU D00476]|uniref:glycoside hydrolase family 9 protein n=1 Tax=Telluribacter sp. SYSU D00476 TaxID=2811430 RepID=UPI001FF1BAAA|nr:glycoside hydrolase family 9 protein [Telluribacter sp. SYSU D00476]